MIGAIKEPDHGHGLRRSSNHAKFGYAFDLAHARHFCPTNKLSVECILQTGSKPIKWSRERHRLSDRQRKADMFQMAVREGNPSANVKASCF